MAPLLFQMPLILLLRALVLVPSIVVTDAEELVERQINESVGDDDVDESVGDENGEDCSTLIVMLEQGEESHSLAAYCETTLYTTLTGCKAAEYLDELEMCILTFTDLNSAQAARDTMNSSPFVQSSESSCSTHFKLAGEPFDPRFNRQWSVTDADLPAAWNIFSGASEHEVVVAVIDTGVDYNHPDLENRMWKDKSYPNGGRDIYYGNADPMDGEGHGTNVAGIIAANGNEMTGAVLTGVQIMALKVVSDKGIFSTSAVFTAINFALQRNVRISTHAYSTPNSHEGKLYKRASDAADKRNHLMIVAAGNDGKSLEDLKGYPCCLSSPSIICVAGVNKDLSLRSFSNYGKTCVDIAAPGEGILSPKTGGGYEARSGTSFAAPIVAGVAALAVGFRPNLTTSALKQAIQDGVKPDAKLKEKVKWGGRVNALVVLAILAARVPEYTPPIKEVNPELLKNTTNFTPPMKSANPELLINDTNIELGGPQVSSQAPTQKEKASTTVYVVIITLVILLVQLSCIGIAWRYKSAKEKTLAVTRQLSGMVIKRVATFI